MLDTAVIPCGGLGTRLQPITRWLPKELLPVGLRPVLHRTLDEIADAGLAGARPEAAWYEVGLPDGCRSAVADFPACA